jgi:uncharacterized membrane protein
MKFLKQLFRFYSDGFRGMTVGRSLWMIILIKLFIIFAIFRLFFFPDYLNSRFDSEEAKSDYVIEDLTNKLP